MPGVPARPTGGGANVGEGREQGVLLEMIGLPPGDLIEQVRFGPAVEGCGGQHCALELGVLRPRKVVSGRNRSRSPTSRPGSCSAPARVLSLLLACSLAMIRLAVVCPVFFPLAGTGRWRTWTGIFSAN